MAKESEKFEHLAALAQKKFKARDKKTGKPTMKVTGKRIFQLAKIITKK